jgi:hypothetical protein
MTVMNTILDALALGGDRPTSWWGDLLWFTLLLVWLLDDLGLRDIRAET